MVSVLMPLPPAPSAAQQTMFTYWCVSSAAGLRNDDEAVLLSYYWAPSPRLALRWMRARAVRLADRLDLDPRAGWLAAAPLTVSHPAQATAADALVEFSQDRLVHEEAMRTLRAGEPYRFSVTDNDARYALSVQPMPL